MRDAKSPCIYVREIKQNKYILWIRNSGNANPISIFVRTWPTNRKMFINIISKNKRTYNRIMNKFGTSDSDLFGTPHKRVSSKLRLPRSTVYVHWTQNTSLATWKLIKKINLKMHNFHCVFQMFLQFFGHIYKTYVSNERHSSNKFRNLTLRISTMILFNVQFWTKKTASSY